jgi:LytS/YehU family sensor histidine kinase
MIVREEGVLELLIAALPHLRGGLREESARFTAELLNDHLDLDAVAISSTDRVLAFIGAGSDHHRVGAPNLTALTRRAIDAGTVLRTQAASEIGCPHGDCPLTSAVVAPLTVRDRVVGAIKLYRVGSRVISEYDEGVARGLARVLSVYLEMAELDERAALVTKAELEALRAQISPHFLFNTLTAIASLTRTDSERAHQLIIDLAEFFRDALAEHSELVALDDELACIQRYLRFEGVRFGARLQVVYNVEYEARGVKIPFMAVQSLVQNAVWHGIAPKSSPGTVNVRAYAAGDGFEIVVSDDGVGIPPGQLAHVLERYVGSGAGVGLDNVHRRLVTLFGPRAGLRIESEPGTGTTVSFRVPAS